MSNSFTNSGLILQVNGENSGTWGNYVDTNESITTLLIGGVSTQSITSGDVTPANADGTADAGKNLTFVCSGTLTGNRALILPTKQRHFIVQNNCTGAFTLTVKTVAGTGVVVPQTGSMHLFCDGTNIVNAVSAAAITAGAITGTTFDGGSIGAITPVQVQGYRPIVTVSGTSKTLALTDSGTFQLATNSSTTTITIDTNANVGFAAGTEIDFFQQGVGQVVFAGAVGVTVQSKSGNLKLTGQYSGGTIKQLAINTWSLVGDLSA